MTKSDLVLRVAEATGLPFTKAESIVSTIIQGMAQELVDGGRVEIRGFGSFSVRDYEPYTGRNPKTGEQVEVKRKKLPFFKPSKLWLKKLND